LEATSLNKLSRCEKKRTRQNGRGKQDDERVSPGEEEGCDEEIAQPIVEVVWF
jgi:hypothetical protein